MNTIEQTKVEVRHPTPDEKAEIGSALVALQAAAPEFEQLMEQCWQAVRVYLAAKFPSLGREPFSVEEEEAFEAAWPQAHALMDLAYKLEGMFAPTSSSGSDCPTPDWFDENDDPGYMWRRAPQRAGEGPNPESASSVVEVKRTPGINLKVDLSPECSDLALSFADLTRRMGEALPGITAMRAEYDAFAEKADPEVAAVVEAWGCSETGDQEEDGITQLLDRVIGYTACSEALAELDMALDGKGAR